MIKKLLPTMFAEKMHAKRIIVLVLAIFFAQNALAKSISVSYNFPLNSGFSDVKQTITIADDANAFSAFVQVANANGLNLEIQFFDFDGDGIKESAFINGINGIKTSADYSKYWSFSVNNAAASLGVSAVVPANNDSIELSYLDGIISDAFEWLADHQETSGLIGANSFQGAFALMASSLGADNNVTIDATVKQKAINYFLSQQQSSASFGDDLATAVATMALLSNGKTLADLTKNGASPIDLLASNQQSDGGFKSGTTASDVDTSSWVAIAFAQATGSMPTNNGKSPIDYLFSAQHANGSFGYNASDATESLDFSEEAIIAFAAAKKLKDGNALNAINWLASKQQGNGCFSDGFRTALGAIALHDYNETTKANNALNCLKTLQNADGSFGRATSKSNAIDTAIAIIALSNKTIPLSVSDANLDSNGFAGLNSLVKFVVKIKNIGRVKAANVNISLNGLPSDWVYGSSQGSINFFSEIAPGEMKNAEIFAKMKSLGSYSVSATVNSESITSALTTNTLSLTVETAKLSIELGIG